MGRKEPDEAIADSRTGLRVDLTIGDKNDRSEEP